MAVAVLIANGSEEIEALTPIDVLRRAGVDTDLISVSSELIKGSHAIEIKADKCVEDVDFSVYDAIIVPGGMPGAINISNCKKAIDGIKDAVNRGVLVASICASPAVVLAENGLLKAKNATCYPAPQFINSLGEKYTGADVEVCDNIITANGPKSAMAFALAICEYLKLNAKF